MHHLTLTYPTVSCLGVMGTTPSLLVRPTVGFMPTTELESEGHKMEPSVSVPRDTVTRFAATDIADPLLDPHGSPIVYGFCERTLFKGKTYARRPKT